MEIIGATAICLGLSGFIWTDPRMVLRLAAAASFVWIIYFVTLDAWAPAIATTFGMIRFLSGAFAPKRMMWTIVIICTALGTPIILWSTPSLLGLLVATGSALKGFSVVTRDRPILFRLMFCTSEACYFTFGVFLTAWSTIIWSVLSTFMALGSATLIRFRSKVVARSTPRVS
jgi:hypothetical protein